MTERRFYIGSYGPFFYNDTDTYPSPGDLGFGEGAAMDAVVTDGSFAVGSVKMFDTDTTHSLELKWNEDDSGDRILNFLVGGGDRSLTMGANLTVEANAIVSQDYSADSTTVSLAGMALTGQLTLTTTDQDGIVFGSLGTATKAIDFTNCALSGASDYLFYLDASNYWAVDGVIRASGVGGQIEVRKILATGEFDIIISGKASGSSFSNTIVKAKNVVTAFLIGREVRVGLWGGDGVSNGSSTITDVAGGAHGLGLAVGDLAHIKNSGTASDEGFYRITANDGTNVVLDRALTGTQTNLTVAFYKDVIYLGATDGTNGNHIIGFSHQDKPLVIGGDRAGTGGGTIPTTSHSLGGEDILIGSKLEVNGAAYFDAAVTFAGTVTVPSTNFTIGSTTFSETQLGANIAKVTCNFANVNTALATANATVDINDQQLSNIKSLAFNDGGATCTQVKDENDMASNSQTMLATQASIKAYADAIGGVSFVVAAALGTL